MRITAEQRGAERVIVTSVLARDLGSYTEVFVEHLAQKGLGPDQGL